MVRVVSDVITGPIEGTQDSDVFAGLTSGIVSAEIDAEGGDDLIVGRNINPNGIGINQSFIDAGPDNDQVFGVGTGESSIGIVGGAIELGGGNDFLLASGTEAGIVDALIDGGPGEDGINVQFGTGLILGGTDQDSLTLSGTSQDYEIRAIDEFFEFIQITGGVDGNTNLLVGQVETVIFQDPNGGSSEIFLIDDIFV